MRGDIVYSIYGMHGGRAEDMRFGTYRTREAAEAGITEMLAAHGESWVRTYHDRGFVVREVVVTTDFEVPPRPMPRECFCALGVPLPNGPEYSASLLVEVSERTATDLRHIGFYVRNYGAFHAFEPFRQGERHFALISRNYTASAVLDLDTGDVIAEEPETDPPGNGFCPVGFYVPDWRDVHDGSVIPGSRGWDADYEWPDGRFGFVWGCIWGDDSSWKVQYLDLSRVAGGVIRCDDRFGRVELATTAYAHPALRSDPPPPGRSAPPFIRVERHDGRTSVQFHVEMDFDLDSGAARNWRRTRHGID